VVGLIASAEFLVEVTIVLVVVEVLNKVVFVALVVELTVGPLQKSVLQHLKFISVELSEAHVAIHPFSFTVKPALIVASFI